MRYWIAMAVLVVATASCGQSATIPSSLATETREPTTTGTATATLTPEPTATLTPTATPDVRVIDGDPHEYLLGLDDMPPDARYYLPGSNWTSPHRNSEIVSGWGVEEGREYLEATGRIDGWWVVYKRGTNTVTAPEQVYDNVILYRDASGPLLVLQEFDITCDNPDLDYASVPGRPTIGEASKACVRGEMQPNGRRRTWYTVEFAYRNVLHNMNAYGWEYEVEYEYLEAIAMTLLAQLQAAPLSDTVAFKP